MSGFSLTCPGFWWPNMRQGEMLNSASLPGIWNNAFYEI